MAKVRTFYGFQGVIAPLGAVARAASEAAAAIETIPGTESEPPVEITAEAVEIPGARAKVEELDAFAEKHGIQFPEGANGKAKRAAIVEWVESLPVLEAAPDEDSDADDESESDEDSDADDTKE